MKAPKYTESFAESHINHPTIFSRKTGPFRLKPVQEPTEKSVFD